MTTQAFQVTHPALGEMITSWLKAFRHVDTPAPGNTPDEMRARRDFVCEMLDRNAGAMTCETDVQSMALVYPGRF